MPTTIGDVIEIILREMPGPPPADTVDTFVSGDPSQPVTGIVSTFLATYAVIQRSVELGANLIISHEGIFFSHRGGVDWLAGDPVYEAKRRLLEEHGMAVWRFHDNWHRYRPDGILTGVLRQLGWEAYADPQQPTLCTLPLTTVGAVAAHIKERLGIDTVRLVGDPAMPCQRVGLRPGAVENRLHMRGLREAALDLLAVGELNEWETSEYVRDAVQIGLPKALLVLGHAQSEEPGMAYLVEWLQERLPGVSITHVPAGGLFRYL
jgi:putative NIF3 family GTP cyclohydrolase 1 type 2